MEQGEQGLLEILNQLHKEKGIPREYIFETIKSALTSAYRKVLGDSKNITVSIDENTGKINVFQNKTVISDNERVTGSTIRLSKAQKIRKDCKIGDIIPVLAPDNRIGRVAAQTAKQLVVQRIREAEREMIYEKFNQLKGEIMVGIIQRREGKNIVLVLDNVETILPEREQLPGEKYIPGNRLKVMVVDVTKGPNGQNILVSRTHPGFLKMLFKTEIPEIAEGIVEIKNIVREPGYRSKVAVYSHNEKIDCVGTCVGLKGSRIQPIIDEINGERIDIIRWESDIKKYLMNSLSPAQISSIIVEEENKSALVVVPDNQLSLAIGKSGQNVRLAARLTGYKIDIKPESKIEKVKKRLAESRSDEALLGEKDDEQRRCEHGNQTST